jgi:hypothetical protein
MKRDYLALFCGLLVVTGVAISPQVNGQTEIPTGELVGVLRTLNTAEVVYHKGTGRFASREEIVTLLGTQGILSQLPIDLENPKPYELAITTSPDGMHYQITLKRTSNMNDKSTWCKTAVFSDDAGVIFLGTGLGCEQPTR